MLGAAVAIAVIVFAPEFLAPILGNFGAYVAAGAIAGGLSAAITGGNVGLGIVLGGIQAGLTFGVGGPLGNALGKVLGSATIGRVIAQGFVGGIMSAVQGSNFGAGFLAAGVGSLGGSLGLGGVEGFIVSTTLGGLASVLGGGKFANGAITAAFAYVASGRTRGFGAPLTLNDYYKLLAQEGIDGHNIAVSAEAKAFMDQVLGTDEFKGVAKPILDESIATKTETGGIDVYADSNGKPIIVPFKAIPMTCPNGYTGCMGAPLPNASYGKIMFEWHPHPVVGYKNWTPSILDLERSILLNHLPGAIWANQRGNYRESVYQGNCIVGATSCH